MYLTVQQILSLPLHKSPSFFYFGIAKPPFRTKFRKSTICRSLVKVPPGQPHDLVHSLPNYTSHHKLNSQITLVSIPQSSIVNHQNELLEFRLSKTIEHTAMFLSKNNCLNVNLTSKRKQSSKPPNLPNIDQLDSFQKYLEEETPRFFLKTHNYNIYSNDFTFINNLFEKEIITRGIKSYAFQLVKLKIYAAATFANVSISIVSITTDAKEGSVKMQWQISGLLQRKAFMFWKYYPWKQNKPLNQEKSVLEGISKFYMNQDGGIYKHHMYRLIQDGELRQTTDGVPFATKLAIMLGLSINQNTSGFSDIYKLLL